MSQISITNEIRLESMSMMNLINSALTESDSNVSSSSESNKRNKGSLFQKSFILLDELGRGGYGFVYRCLNKKNRRMYAVKWNINPADMAGLKEEFFTVSDICFPNGHVNIVNVLGSICDDQIVYNIFELASGGDLASDLEEKGYYSEAFAADIVKQVLQGVDYIHSRGYLHRDIKPQNLLILKSSYLHIKITDFGLAIRRKKGLNYGDKSNNQIFAYLPWQHGFAGTESYISPEIMKSHKYDYDCDIWSCGVVLYEILSGYLPFDDGIPMINSLSDLFPMPEWRGLDQAIDLIRQIFDRVKPTSTSYTSDSSVSTVPGQPPPPPVAGVAMPTSSSASKLQDVDNYHQQTFLTARQALDHPFFAKNCYNRKLRPDMSSAMVHFLGMKRLKSEFIKIRKDNFNF